jgi:hypothetical protein
MTFLLHDIFEYTSDLRLGSSVDWRVNLELDVELKIDY